MDIEFDNPKHEALINNHEALSKKYNKNGQDHGTEIITAMDILSAADTLFEVPRSYRPHPLKGEYRGFFAVDVNKKERIIFRPNHGGDPNFRIDNYKAISAILITEIFKDYH